MRNSPARASNTAMSATSTGTRHSARASHPFLAGLFSAIVAVIVAACAGSSDAASSAGTASAAGAAVPADASAPAAHTPVASGDSLLVTTWKTPTCGCCSAWVDYMRQAGYRVSAHDVADVTPVKRQHGVLEKDQSCHTSLVGGYVVEGHVPAEDIRRMLAERPDIVGIAAPGMPHGSPGMETGIVHRYDVVAIGKDGSRKVWATHGGQ